MKRGPRTCDPAPLTADEVVNWFAKSRFKPSYETCVEVATRLDGPPSAEWLVYSREGRSLDTSKIGEFDYWDFSEISKGLDHLIGALPRIREHWENVADCDHAFSARSKLSLLDVALVESRQFIDYPFGRYDKSHRHVSKSWHIAAIFTVDIIRKAIATVKGGPVPFSDRTLAMKVTKLALSRLGYGNNSPATIARYIGRRYEKYGDPMATNEG